MNNAAHLVPTTQSHRRPERRIPWAAAASVLRDRSPSSVDSAPVSAGRFAQLSLAVDSDSPQAHSADRSHFEVGDEFLEHFACHRAPRGAGGEVLDPTVSGQDP